MYFKVQIKHTNDTKRSLLNGLLEDFDELFTNFKIFTKSHVLKNGCQVFIKFHAKFLNIDS